jgi:hypothetical protein
MTTVNFIPSKYCAWSGGQKSKGIVLAHLVEDPLFKASHSSYFLQFADFVVYALLKREVPPTAHVAKYNIHQMFDVLKPVLCLKASSDPFGIVRG